MHFVTLVGFVACTEELSFVGSSSSAVAAGVFEDTAAAAAAMVA